MSKNKIKGLEFIDTLIDKLDFSEIYNTPSRKTNTLREDLTDVLISGKSFNDLGPAAFNQISKGINFILSIYPNELILEEYSPKVKERHIERISNKYKIYDKRLLIDYFKAQREGRNSGYFVKFWKEKDISSEEVHTKQKVKRAYYELVLGNLELNKLKKI